MFPVMVDLTPKSKWGCRVVSNSQRKEYPVNTKYVFDLITRQVVPNPPDFSTTGYPAAVCCEECISTPEGLIACVIRGEENDLSLRDVMHLLTVSAQAEWKKAYDAADEPYLKIRASMWAEFERLMSARKAVLDKETGWARFAHKASCLFAGVIVALTTLSECEKDFDLRTLISLRRIYAHLPYNYDMDPTKIWVDIFSKPENRIESWR